jgi:MOSC domain-containing protein YiiM
MWRGNVEAIHVGPEAAGALPAVREIRAVPGRGLEGDRYFFGTGTYSNHPGNGREVTLIEAEAIEAIAREAGIVLAPGASRRNIVTRGVPLNHLVGRMLRPSASARPGQSPLLRERFRIGEVVLEATRLCEPCAHLEALTARGVKSALVHRGGVRTVIVEGGTIRVGDPIEHLPAR